MTYEEARQTRDKHDADLAVLSKALQQFPKGPMGLTPDAVKTTAEFQNAKRAYDAAAQRSRNFNQFFVRTYKKEYAADRQQKREAAQAALVGGGG